MCFDNAKQHGGASTASTLFTGQHLICKKNTQRYPQRRLTLDKSQLNGN